MEHRVERLRAGVVGAGVFGTFHARKYASLRGVDLAGVFDPDAARAQARADDLGVASFQTLEALLDACQVVSVASPADSHAETAAQGLSAGLHVYVEKPLAIDVASGRRLVDLAAEQGRVLACGHQERVVFAAMGLLEALETPRHIDSVRRGVPNTRNRDVSCVLDLMIHDLDLALSLGRRGWTTVAAKGGFDEVRAEIAFEGGMTASFEALRGAEQRERTMALDYDSGRVDIDFLAPSFRNGAGLPLNPDFAATADGRDPLGANLSGFLAAVRGEVPRPIVTGADGLAALELALEIERAAGL